MCVSLYSRETKLKEGALAAISVPLKLACKANTLWPTLKQLAAVANIACKSDLQVGISRSFTPPPTPPTSIVVFSTP